jgi:hypothetical protein
VKALQIISLDQSDPTFFRINGINDDLGWIFLTCHQSGYLGQVVRGFSGRHRHKLVQLTPE